MLNLRSWLSVVPLFTLTALLLSATTTQIPKIEKNVETAAQQALSVAQISWAKLEVSGQDVIILGTAPTVELKEYAVSQLNNIPLINTVTDNLTINPPEKPYIIRFLKNDSQIIVEGAVPLRATKDKIFEAIRATIPNASLQDKTHFASGLGNNSNWESGVFFGIAQLNRMQTGEAKIIDGQFEINGVTTTLEAYDAIQSAYQQLPEGFKVSLNNIAITKPENYQFSIEKNQNTIELSGFMPNLLRKQEYLAFLQTQMPSSTVNESLRIAQGAPASFDSMVTTAVKAIQNVQNGKISVSNDTLTVKAAPETYEIYEKMNAEFYNLASDIKLVTKEFIQPEKIELQPLRIEILNNKATITGELSNPVNRLSLINSLQNIKPISINESITYKNAKFKYEYFSVLDEVVKSVKYAKEFKLEFLPDGANIYVQSIDNASYNLLTQFFAHKIANVNNVKISPPPQIPFTLTIIKDGNTVEFTGYVPSTEARLSLLNALKTAISGITMIDTMTLAATQLNVDVWLETAKILTQLTSKFSKSTITFVDMNISISGQPNNTNDGSAISGLIAQLPQAITVKSVSIQQ